MKPVPPCIVMHGPEVLAYPSRRISQERDLRYSVSHVNHNTRRTLPGLSLNDTLQVELVDHQDENTMSKQNW